MANREIFIPEMTSELENMAVQKAASLINHILEQSQSCYASGSMTCSIYDTAWMACVSREVAGRRLWWFPNSFSYLLDHVLEQGGWDAEHGDTGSLLNSLMGLYALVLHQEWPYQLCPVPSSTLPGIIRSTSARVQEALDNWDIAKATEVGFEVLLPTVLELLDQKGIRFTFPCRDQLLDIRSAKLANIRYECIYNGQLPSIIHSLEAFYNDPDFDYDRMRPQAVSGSMLGSPSATTAYLMRCSQWDVEAEAYLNIVLNRGTGLGSGAVPSAYPSNCFELLWTTSTILTYSLKRDQLEPEMSDAISKFIHKNRVGPSGLLSFAPGLLPDLDDSAKASITLSLLGQRGLSQEIVQSFAAPTHFKTYDQERNPSLSANANALLALLLDTYQNYDMEIQKIIVFILVTFKKSAQLPADKWNESPYYTAMLVVQALVAVLRTWKQGRLSSLPKPILREGITLALIQSMTRVLLRQNENGSWGGIEETCYATLALVELSNAPFSSLFSQQVSHAITRAQEFLVSAPENTEPEKIWIEKVKYGSAILSRAFYLSATASKPFQDLVSSTELNIFSSQSQATDRFLSFMQKLPALNALPRWLAVASWLEGQQFFPELETVRTGVFNREGFTEDKYFDWIPFIWCAVNNLNEKFLPSDSLYDMMAISVLNYQADEFMEHQIATRLGNRLDDVRAMILSIFGNTKHLDSTNGCTMIVNDSNAISGVIEANKGSEEYQYSKGSKGALNAGETSTTDLSVEALSVAYASLNRFRDFVSSRPCVQKASESDRNLLFITMKKFLLAHVTQAEDNQRGLGLTKITNGPANHAFEATETVTSWSKSIGHGSDFKTWVRTTAAEHTSCCYSFAFMACSGHAVTTQAPGVSFFPSMYAKYIADDLCRHLAAMCRMYNDFGSVHRDMLERNLNSVNFDELRCISWDRQTCYVCERTGGRMVNGDYAKNGINNKVMSGCSEAKARLMRLAQYERSQLNVALDELRKVCSTQVMDIVDVFVEVTDVFGQVYEVRDIASRHTG